MHGAKETQKRKPKRKLVVIVVVIALILAAAAAFIVFNMGAEQRKMNALETGEFLPGIFAINNGYVNMFLIKADAGYIAIDAGANAKSVEQGLAKLGISSGEVSAVLLTHTHGDHTAALAVFDNATVYGAKQTTGRHVLADGETIGILGKEIKVIAAPGHADDSVCYLVDGYVLFTGDNMSLDDNAAGLFNSVYNKSDEQQKQDIKKLSGVSGVEYIITAHYGFTGSPVFP